MKLEILKYPIVYGETSIELEKFGEKMFLKKSSCRVIRARNSKDFHHFITLSFVCQFPLYFYRYRYNQKQQSDGVLEKGALTNFANFTRKYM